MKLLGTILAVFFLYSCATTILSNSKKLKSGQTTDKAEAIMGKAEDVQTDGDRKALQWCSTGYKTNTFIVGYFEKGKLTKVEEYTRQLIGPCSLQFKKVNL